MAMISTGDYSEAKVFRRVDAQAMLTILTERLVRIPRGIRSTGTNSQHTIDLLEVYRGQIKRLVR